MSPSGWKETRLLLCFMLLGFLAAAVITIWLSGPSARRSAATPAIARAAYVTSSQAGFKFTLAESGDIAGNTFSLSGQGSIDPPGSGSFQMIVGGRTINELVSYPDIYMQVPGLGSLASTPWIKVRLTSLMRSMGESASTLQSGSESDPSELLSYLKASGPVVVVDREIVGGVPTIRYHALANLDRLPSVVPPDMRSATSQQSALLERMTGQSTLPVDAWVDSSNRLRRFEMQMPLCTPAGHGSVALQMDIYGFGRQPQPAVPDPSQVTDVTHLIGSQVSQATSQMSCA